MDQLLILLDILVEENKKKLDIKLNEYQKLY